VSAIVLVSILILLTRSGRDLPLRPLGRLPYSVGTSSLEPPERAVSAPEAPPGYEVPSGSAPSEDSLFQSAVTVPAGYALTLTATVSSNQVVVRRAEPALSAFVIAPSEQDAQASLKWRLLGNTIAADGAPMEFSLSLNEEGQVSHTLFHFVPPEPLSIDWVGDPQQIWPPHNGRTKFVLARGKVPTAQPASEPAVEATPDLTASGDARAPGGVEWTVGIEARLDPIPQSVGKVHQPTVGLGTNWLSGLGMKRVPVPAEESDAQPTPNPSTPTP
jgi:hypothetical protein